MHTLCTKGNFILACEYERHEIGVQPYTTQNRSRLLTVTVAQRLIEEQQAKENALAFYVAASSPILAMDRSD